MNASEFVDHFRYLADTPGWERVPEAIAAHVTASKMEGDDLVVELDRKDTRFVASPPAKESYAKWPPAFRALVKHHENVSFPSTGWALSLGDSGSVDFEVEGLPHVREVMVDYSDWWVVADGGIARLAKLFKKADVQAWCREGEVFWVVLVHDAKKTERPSLTGVRLPSCEEIGPIDLPADVPWRDAAWMKIEGAHMTVLFENAVVRRLELEKTFG